MRVVHEAAVGGDGQRRQRRSCPATTVPHPRSYGTFPRKIGRYAIEDKVDPARAGDPQSPAACRPTSCKLPDRGYLKAGYFADVVVFDPKTFRDTATLRQAAPVRDRREVAVRERARGDRRRHIQGRRLGGRATATQGIGRRCGRKNQLVARRTAARIMTSLRKCVAIPLSRAMYAIFEDGSRQYRVEPNSTVVIDYRDVQPGQQIELAKVLLVQTAPRR